ncbi:VOC family protein [Bacillus sp. H-16]|uniref:glyoxalase superfamily protein n=1 Tax=Alteribacter salitolerans TaxID=2912333 RepID=UPI001964F31F|nr:VOC family protein [Alteribacter salitolerans]
MSKSKIKIKSPIPIFRIFDEEKAKEFYITFLEFELDWEHRFEENFPLYMQISQGNCILHLSEHFGDSTPGSSIRIEVENVKMLHSKLVEKEYKYARPGLETTDWNTLEVRIGDPFGNKIVFYENIQK